MDTKMYYQAKYTKKCVYCGFPMAQNDFDLCDECNSKELMIQNIEREARLDYLVNGGHAEDF